MAIYDVDPASQEAKPKRAKRAAPGYVISPNRIDYTRPGARAKVAGMPYRRWWKDAESTRLIQLVAGRFMTYWHTPVLRMGLRYLRDNPPTAQDLDYLQATSQSTKSLRENAQESSWVTTEEDRQIQVDLMAKYGLTLFDVQRLAIRCLARSLGFAVEETPSDESDV